MGVDAATDTRLGLGYVLVPVRRSAVDRGQ
jgi:hypothetical protein